MASSGRRMRAPSRPRSTVNTDNNDDDDRSFSPPPPPPSNGGRDRIRRASTSGKRRTRHRGQSLSREKAPRKANVTIVLAVYHSSRSHTWRTTPITFDRYRATDQSLWEDIRYAYRHQLQKEWRRVLLFTRLKHIVPIEFTHNDVPIQFDPKDLPNAHSFMHAYHHPDRLRTSHQWVDWFVELESTTVDKSYGLEFKEGLWAEKLALVAILVTIAIIVVSVVWCVLGGDLQTVFTVMGFVLTFAAAEIALVALYYQVQSPAT